MNNLFKRRWIWLKRFRKRCGYGVHSPFAFDFITWVVYEKGEYYAYEELRRKYGGMRLGHRLKCSRFLFRLSNYVHPEKIEIVGRLSDEHMDYLTAGCKSAGVVQHNVADRPDDVGRGTLCVISDVSPDLWKDWALREMSHDSVCIISGIYDSDEHYSCWKELCESDCTVVSFDLYDYGILFYDRKKLKQDYVVNFN